MKKYIAFIAIAAFIGAAFVFQYNRMQTIQADRSRLEADLAALMSKAHSYRVRDSLSALNTFSLQLKIKEYKKMRADDYSLIKELKIKNRELQSVSNVQQQTIVSLRGNVKDSIIYIDNVRTDTLRCVDVHNKWYDFHGCADKSGAFSGTFVNRDSLLLVEHVKYKKFLWIFPTKKVKSRHFDVISRNPHTKIVDVEHILLKNE